MTPPAYSRITAYTIIIEQNITPQTIKWRVVNNGVKVPPNNSISKNKKLSMVFFMSAGKNRKITSIRKLIDATNTPKTIVLTCSGAQIFR